MLLNNLFIQEHQTISDHILETKLSLVKNHSVFKGHFPEQPVLPGVCMIQVNKELLEAHLKFPLMMDSSKQVKFLHVVNPLEMDYVVSKIAWQEKDKEGQKVYHTKFELLAPKGHVILKMQATFIPCNVHIN